MFDLIDESGQDLKRYGYAVKQLENFDMSIAYMQVDSIYKSQKLGLGKGEYYIINSPSLYGNSFDNDHFLIKQISSKLKLLFSSFSVTHNDKILIVGIGNPDIDADKLGKVVFDNVEVDALNKNNRIFKICPNIFFSTGIETFDLVKMLVKGLKANLVIIIDSLTTSSLSRLGTSFQITTSGLTPGSGVNRFGKRINSQSIGAKCISIGVPFMIFSGSINSESPVEVVLSPKDIKENVERAGFIIAKAIEEVLKWTYFFWFLSLLFLFASFQSNLKVG